MTSKKMRKLMDSMDNTRVYPKGFVYHAAPIEHRASIESKGILPKTGGTTFLNRTYSPRIHLTVRIEAAWDFTMSVNARREQPIDYDIYVIDVSKLPTDTVFYEDPKFSDYGIWTQSKIPKTAIVGRQSVNHDWEPDDEYYAGGGTDHKR